jgi:hypothetical protein
MVKPPPEMAPCGQGRGAVGLDGVLVTDGRPRVRMGGLPNLATQAAQVAREARLQRPWNAGAVRVGNCLVQQVRVGASVRLPSVEQRTRLQHWPGGPRRQGGGDNFSAGLVAEPRIDVPGKQDEQDLRGHPAENGQDNHFANVSLHTRAVRAVRSGLTAVVARRHGHEVVIPLEWSAGQHDVASPSSLVRREDRPEV